MLARSLRSALLLSVGASVAPVPVGLYLSFVWDLPSAATVVALQAVVLCAAFLFSRVRLAR
jgi:ABC-type Mn2+/Zn2+ transport system permease subunit